MLMMTMLMMIMLMIYYDDVLTTSDGDTDDKYAKPHSTFATKV